MQQQYGPISITDDQNENKKSNAIELHDEGLKNLYSVIKKQQARDAKKELKKLEAEKSKTENKQKDE